jgi:outer membrane protein, heavy metal efflux system
MMSIEYRVLRRPTPGPSLYRKNTGTRRVEYEVFPLSKWANNPPFLRGDRRWSVQRNRQGCVDGFTNHIDFISMLSACTEHTPKSPLKRGLFEPLIIVLFAAIISVFSINTSLSAQDIDPISASYPQLQEYLRIATEENPELRSLWHQYRAELERIPQVSALPDPEVRIGYTLNPMNSDPFLGRFTASAMQMFPWFGTLQTRRDIQRATAETDYQRLNSRQLELFRDIQTTWFDLAELNRQIEIARETMQLIQDLESLVTVRYETARAGQADLLRIQMEEQRLRTLIENLEDRLNPIRAKFNAYLNRDPEMEVLTPDQIVAREIVYNEDELRARVREQNPAFNELDAREQMLNEQRNLARLNGRPSFGLGVEVMGRNSAAMSMFPNSGDMFAAMATIRVPLYRTRYSAQYKQASEQLQSVDYRRTETDNRFTTELEQALEQHRETVRTITLLDQELIPRAEQALEILSEEYASGNVRFDEVLRLQEQLLELELEQVEALVNQHKAIIKVETLVGDMAPYQRSTEFNE